MAFGRPTKYKPEYCEKVIELLKQGYSLCEIALELDIAVDTLHEWRKRYKEFSDAINTGRGFSEGWWTSNGRLNLHNKETFNTTLWYMNMKNRFGWRDKSEQEITLKESPEVKEVQEARKQYESTFIKEI